jgi:CubicO group peptidase (beta-lactamase class C family)
MTILRASCLVSAVAVSIVVCRVAPASAQAPSNETIKTVLDGRVDSKGPTCIVVGVIDGAGRRSVSAGTLSPAGAAPDGNTVFEIGSVTKVFTSALLAEMAQRGDVRLDEPVAKLLPPDVKVPLRGRPITLADLATHTSGLPRLPSNMAPKNASNPYADYTVQQMYAFLSGYALARDVGVQYEYSNLGAGLLGHALALRAAASYEDALVRRVLTPLGMTDTRITLIPAMRGRLAAGHNQAGYAVPNWDLPALAGAGALRSTVNDMLTFLQANMKPPATAVGRALAETHTPRHPLGAAPGRIGLGWHIRPSSRGDIVWHNGGTGGYHSFIGFDPARGIGVVVLHNSAASIDDIGLHLLDETVPLAKRGATTTTPRKEIAVAPEVLDACVGEYQLSPTFVISVRRRDKQLFIQATGQTEVAVFPESETRFFLKVVDAQIEFVKDADGKVNGLILHQGGRDQRASRK